jgi:hypothetical protein
MKRFARRWMLLVLVACGKSEETGPPEEPSVDAEACEHYRAGPFVAATATLERAAAPDVSAEHAVHRIALSELGAGGSGGGAAGQGARGGWVKLAADAVGDRILFFDAAVPVTVEDATGAAVGIEASCNGAACSADCPVVRARHVVPFAVGTYFLELGPTSTTEVGFAHEEAGGHAGE